MYPEDLQARVVSHDGYEYQADSPISAFEIVSDGTVGCYIWYADDASLDAAGIVSIPAAGAAAARAAVALADQLRAAKAAGQTAKDAVLALRGLVAAHEAWVVSAEPQAYPKLAVLRQQAQFQG